ncbi:arsenic metallochaperone ArsD family protein [Clostridium sp. DJ247]|uniref:arsenite efflux transporter metallochaperone ArsD n=1 Tax=Clostridium sp. DJ247 TaxID=2726188 RepID=UPI001629486D|nr:arsenic metallochaperone ArsD family protein [Clostridium sp. DJ247]MBC2579033.1 arsenic metallochaperone ArsD family protein [Clostridium sp. DJ247]
MISIEIFETVTCCSGGFDKELLKVSSTINNLKQEGIRITRYNLSKEPQAFVDNKIINDYIAAHGIEELPITIVNDKIVKLNQYPTVSDFSGWVGITIDTSSEESSGKGCSCGCK